MRKIYCLIFVLSCALFLPSASAQTYYPWMSTEVNDAWNAGYKGQNVSVTVVDDFSNSSAFTGNLGGGFQTQGHGFWTAQEAGMIAPSAAIIQQNWSSNAVPLASNKLNVLNLSYGMYAKSGYSVNNIAWSNEEKSIIAYAKNGSAVVVKAAGNDGSAVGASVNGQTDYLNLSLKGAQSAIYAGALNKNGTITNPASMAPYSNVAGKDIAVQRQFLVVGVASDTTGLAGTSFAAPILSGYAAILGSKFTSAGATQIRNQLLNTARTDTVMNYRASVYGQGEASITRALAPVSIK